MAATSKDFTIRRVEKGQYLVVYRLNGRAFGSEIAARPKDAKAKGEKWKVGAYKPPSIMPAVDAAC